MPPASNLGLQNNLFLMEVGMVRRNPFLPDAPPLVRVVALHPLVVVPESITYVDESRSQLQETGAGGAFLTVSGRARRRVSFEGTFGVESRAFGLYVGNGDLRFQRFYHEVVRLPDATNRDDVNAEKDWFRSPIVAALLGVYDEESTTFYVNFYDLWHGVTFQAQVVSFQFSKKARGGGATGLTRYQLTIREVGPLVTGSLITAILSALFKALSVWSSVNDIIASYTLDVIASGLVNVAGVFVQQFVGSVNAVKAQIDGATALLSGQSNPGETIGLQTKGLFAKDSTSESRGYSTEAADEAGIEARSSNPDNGTSGLGRYLGHTAELARNALELRDAVGARHQDRELRSPPGRIRWNEESGEGAIEEIDAVDSIDRLSEVSAAATTQAAMGAFYGMGRAEFALYLASTGRSGRDGYVAGTVLHRVGPVDTVASLERTYGISWDRILRNNPGLSADELLLVGTEILIPRDRPIASPSPVDGLPTFGSHLGQEAWGRGLYTDLRCAGGEFVVCKGEDILIQGIDWILRDSETEILDGVNELPSTGVTRSEYAAAKIRALLVADRRLASVDTVAVTAQDAALDVEVTATAINGGTISTAAR